MRVEFGVLIVVLLGLFFGFLVLQGTFAARAWRERIADGDFDVLREALDDAFEVWRGMRPPKGMPAADWAALASPELVAADRDRARVSLVADADVRVVGGERRELAGPLLVGRRVALRMAERLLYDIPHVRFDEVQIDVWERYRDASGATIDRALLTTRATREQAAEVDWAVRWELEAQPAPAGSPPDAEGSADAERDPDAGGDARADRATGDAASLAAEAARDLDPAAVLARWRTREAAASPGAGSALDPDVGALIAPGEGIDIGAGGERDGGAEATRRPVAPAATRGGAAR